MFFYLLILCVILIYFYLRDLVNSNREYWENKGIVYAKHTIWKFLYGDRCLAEVYKDIYDSYPNEKNVGISLGLKPALIIRNLGDIQSIMVGDFRSFHSRGIVTNPNDVLSDNILFMSDNKRWKIVRQSLAPIFSNDRLNHMVSIIDRCARDFVEVMEDNPFLRSKPFDALFTYTNASTSSVVFGIGADDVNTMESPFLDKAWKTVAFTRKAIFKFLVSTFSPKLFNILNLKTFGEHEKYFVSVVKQVLKERRAKKERRYDFIDVCYSLESVRMRYDFMTKYEIVFSIELLAAQAFFFFIAGLNTTANTMHFTLLELSRNKDILRKVHIEIDTEFEACKENITHFGLHNLRFLNMVVNETLRKYPPIGFIQRVCTKNTVLPASQVVIEKDTVVIVPVYGLHRDPKYYPNPEVFDPERFNEKNTNNREKFSYLPFGEGNRVCMGMRFARLQIIAGLARLLRTFTLIKRSEAQVKLEKSFSSIRDQSALYKIVVRDEDFL